MFQGEEIIWERTLTKGMFKKEVVARQIITNQRVLENGIGGGLGVVDDIVVMNAHTTSKSQYSGISTGARTRVHSGLGSTLSNSIGDVIFLQNGTPVMTFKDVVDPRGVVQLALAARKAILQKVEKDAADLGISAEEFKARASLNEPPS
jgi:hypothetical protein